MSALEAWTSSATLEFSLCGLAPAELRACGAASRYWRETLDARVRLPWRAALRHASPGISVALRESLEVNENNNKLESLAARWPGLEVALPFPEAFCQLAAAERDDELLALPLRSPRSAGAAESSELQHWPELDYGRLVCRLRRWSVDGVLPVCPLCAGVAFYRGPHFTCDDIPTGWSAYLLAPRREVGPDQNGQLSKLWANFGIDAEAGAPVVVQLRSRPCEDGCAQQIEAVGGFAGIWRSGRSPFSENIVSVSLPCGRRLCLAGQPLRDLGVAAFFCDQTGKYAKTSRTRVGRYLDDQPVHTPRAHVFGVAVGPGAAEGTWLPAGCLEEKVAAAPETCPFCCGDGTAVRSSAVSVLSSEADAVGDHAVPLPFHGALWVCASRLHIWGWRARRAGMPITED